MRSNKRENRAGNINFLFLAVFTSDEKKTLCKATRPGWDNAGPWVNM